eukprot:9768318-Ditylum_brightwellii.AAC.1
MGERKEGQNNVVVMSDHNEGKKEEYDQALFNKEAKEEEVDAIIVCAGLIPGVLIEGLDIPLWYLNEDG